MLTETSPALIESLKDHTGLTCFTQHTGGGCYVAVVDLTIDGRGLGRQVWLTRDGDWLLGFYDFAEFPEDEGIVVPLSLIENPDEPDVVAYAVTVLLNRVGATLQGEPGRLAIP